MFLETFSEFFKFFLHVIFFIHSAFLLRFSPFPNLLLNCFVFLFSYWFFIEHFPPTWRKTFCYFDRSCFVWSHVFCVSLLLLIAFDLFLLVVLSDWPVVVFLGLFHSVGVLCVLSSVVEKIEPPIQWTGLKSI